MYTYPYDTGESAWWTLSFAERVHLEHCIHAIVYDRYQADPARVQSLIFCANQIRHNQQTNTLYRLSDNPLVAAVCWRLQEELYSE